MKRRERPEEIVQRACVEYLEWAVPAPPDGPAWTAINPVSAKSKAVAGVSKAMGLRAGVPDLLMVFRGLPIFVEFKAEGEGPSAAQIAMHADIRAAGGEVYLAYSVEDFLGVLSVTGIKGRSI